MRRCTPNFLAVPWIVPTPWVCSRLICSNSSTLRLLSIGPLVRSADRVGRSMQGGPNQMRKVGQIRLPKSAANRLNAKRSTGPRTDRGKNTSKFNAVKAGLFAKHVVIPLCDGEGSEEQFARLLADLKQKFQPEDPLEEFYVEDLAKSMWRIRRATCAEKGSVRRRRLPDIYFDLKAKPSRTQSALCKAHRGSSRPQGPSRQLLMRKFSQ